VLATGANCFARKPDCVLWAPCAFAGFQIVLVSHMGEGNMGKYVAENRNAWRGAILGGAALT